MSKFLGFLRYCVLAVTKLINLDLYLFIVSLCLLVMEQMFYFIVTNKMTIYTIFILCNKFYSNSWFSFNNLFGTTKCFPGIADPEVSENSTSYTMFGIIFLAYPTGISVNPTGARKCHLT